MPVRILLRLPLSLRLLDHQPPPQHRRRRISLLPLHGVPWAGIAEFVGQRDLTVTANVYSRVMDEAELDYAEMIPWPVPNSRSAQSGQ